MSAKKKVIFCTYSSIYSAKVLECLIADEDIEVVAIINSTRVLNPSYNPIQGALYQLKNSGLRYSSYLFLITDIFKWIQPFSKLHKQPLRDTHSLAKMNAIPIFETRDINLPEAINFIENSKSDYLLCAHFNQLLKEPVLSIESVECINIHPSLLPSYKGVDPVFYAMQDDVVDIGVSLHRMDKSFDSGEILSQASITLDKSKTLLINNCELFEQGIKLAIAWMRDGEKQSVNSAKNNHLKSENYDSWPTRNDIKRFKNSGKKLMNLSALWKQQ